jgi:ribosomal protein S18 acetylase RimI-like enzyme
VTDSERLHAGLAGAFARLCSVLDGARFEQRAGYDLVSYPPLPLAQVNGVWVREDGAAVADALPAALAELEPTGAPLWVQTRVGQTVSQQAARRLGFTVEEPIPGMALRPAELRAPAAAAEVEVAETEADFDAVLGVLAAARVRTYLVRDGGEVASTALAFASAETVGICNVATHPRFRRRGHGAAVTAAAARDGLENGADIAWLQSSRMGEPLYRRLGFRHVVGYLALTRP